MYEPDTAEVRGRHINHSLRVVASLMKIYCSRAARCLFAITLMAANAAYAQTIYEKKDKFDGSTHYFTQLRTVKLEGGSFVSMRYVTFSFHAFVPSAGRETPYLMTVNTNTPDWVFISSGSSLILKLNGTEMMTLVGPGSLASRDVQSSTSLSEMASYAITAEQIEHIGQSKTVDFRIIGDKQTVTGSWKADLIADAASMSAKGPTLLGAQDLNDLHRPSQQELPIATSAVYFGIKMLPVPAAMVGLLKLADDKGAWVGTVEPHSVAEAAGIETGDVILKYDGSPIATPKDLIDLIHRSHDKQVVPVVLWHGYAEKTIDVHFDASKVHDASAAAKVQAFGATGMAVSASSAAGLKLSDTNGVLVAVVYHNSIAQLAGIKQADVILKFKDTIVHGVSELNDLIINAPPGQEIPLVVWRQDAEVTLAAHF